MTIYRHITNEIVNPLFIPEDTSVVNEIKYNGRGYITLNSKVFLIENGRGYGNFAYFTSWHEKERQPCFGVGWNNYEGVVDITPSLVPIHVIRCFRKTNTVIEEGLHV